MNKRTKYSTRDTRDISLAAMLGILLLLAFIGVAIVFAFNISMTYAYDTSKNECNWNDYVNEYQQDCEVYRCMSEHLWGLGSQEYENKYMFCLKFGVIDG